MASDHVATVRRYDKVWAETDATRRLDTLSKIWADDGFYIDPDVPEGVLGAQGLSDFVASSVEELPGLTIVPTSDVVSWVAPASELPLQAHLGKITVQ